MPDSWTIRHFSQGNPEGEGQDDVPALLRRVADTIEALGDIEVQDLIMGTRITADGPWYDLTVYFHAPEDDDDPNVTAFDVVRRATEGR